MRNSENWKIIQKNLVELNLFEFSGDHCLSRLSGLLTENRNGVRGFGYLVRDAELEDREGEQARDAEGDLLSGLGWQVEHQQCHQRQHLQ